MDRAFVARNEALLARLVALVDSLSDADLGMQLDDGWRITAALAHLAFWDRFAVRLLQQWSDRGYSHPGHDEQVINAAALADWLAAPTEYVRQEVLRAAAAADSTAAAVGDALGEAIVAGDSRWALERHLHREEHIAQIERALAG
jgi:hypothetical protein